MNWVPVQEFVSHHKEFLELFGLASAVTMRKTLPWPFNKIEILEWSYEWLRDALLTLVSLKGPVPHGHEAQSSERVTQSPDGKIERVKESTVSGSVPEVPEQRSGLGNG